MTQIAVSPSFARAHPVATFFGLAIGIQVLLVALVQNGLDNIWIARLRIYSPAILALSVAYFAFGRDRARQLLTSLTVWRAPLWAYGFALCYPGVIAFLSVGLMYLVGLNETVELDHGPLFSRGLWVLITQISLIEEIAWVGFVLFAFRRRYRFFPSCLWTGALWGLWYVPLVLYEIQVVPGLPIVPVIVNFMVIAVICGWLYERTKSALLVAIMQVTTNFTSLVVPVLPEQAGLLQYYVFVALKAAFAVSLVALSGCRASPAPSGNRAPA